MLTTIAAYYVDINAGFFVRMLGAISLLVTGTSYTEVDLLFTALHEMQTLSSDEISLCLSNACIVT